MYKIIALWSHPRSMSTATERIMRERGDFICHHEPFMYDYYVHRKVREMPHFDIEQNRPQSYREIRDMIMRDAEKGPVFFKDMSYYVVPQILDDAEFLQSVTHCFLIRDPVPAILSYYKLDPQVTLEEIGLETQWLLYEVLLDRGLKPVVIEAESIRNNPKGALSALWNEIGIDYEKKGFEWQDKKPKDWGQVSGWHGDVIHSDGIRPIDPDETMTKFLEFEKLVRSQPHLREFLDHHVPFYEKLQSTALSTKAV
ncbi:MAG: hypothetical protein ACR2O3_18400 [Rhizobiaceae bacterium]